MLAPALPRSDRLKFPGLSPEAQRMAALLMIAHRAIAADTAMRGQQAHEAQLKSAYAFHKATRGIDRVERGTPEWDAMIAATASEYEDAEKAKRDAYNARRRLQTAIRNYQTS